MTEEKSVKKWWLRQCSRFNSLPLGIYALYDDYKPQEKAKLTEASASLCLLLATALHLQCLLFQTAIFVLIWLRHKIFNLWVPEYFRRWLNYVPRCPTILKTFERFPWVTLICFPKDDAVVSKVHSTQNKTFRGPLFRWTFPGLDCPLKLCRSDGI